MRKLLIDKALEKCGGNEAELARRLEISRSMVSLLRRHKRPITPEIAGLLAEIAGVEIAPVVMGAMLDQFSKTERGQRVREAMQTAFLAGAVATFGTFATQKNERRTATTTQSVDEQLTEYASYELSGFLRRVGDFLKSTWGLLPHTPAPGCRAYSALRGPRFCLQ